VSIQTSRFLTPTKISFLTPSKIPLSVYFIFRNSTALVISRLQWLISAEGKSSKMFNITMSTKSVLFLISNFSRVLNVVCFLLGNSPVSEFYMPTFRNTLFHLRRRLWRWNRRRGITQM